MNVLVILFLTVFPLIFDNYYFNITITKYKTFVILSLAVFFLGIYYSLCANMEKNGTLKGHSLSFYLHHLSTTDILFLLFLLSASFSWMMSEWKLPALSGACGKYIGLLFMLMTGGLYYGISRHMTPNRYIRYIFPVILIPISLMAVLQFGGYDVLGFYRQMAAGTSQMYIATFGHIDVFSAFLCVYLPICLYLFCYSCGRELYLYGMGCFMGFLSIFAANSDSCYIGFIISMTILLLLTVSKTDKLKKYSILLFLLSLSEGLWNLLHSFFGSAMREESSLTAAFTSVKMIFLSVLLGIILFALSFFFEKQKEQPPKWISYVITAFSVTAFLLLVVLFVLFSFIDTEREIGALENYLRFNVHWGSDRGYVWKWLFQFFCSVPLLTKLFGAGPDTTTLILYKNFKTEMSDELGVFYASAHNEYLNYLVTIGLVGTILYIGMLLVSIIKCFKKRYEDAFYGAVGLAIIAYSAMALVNISQPITMPFLYLLIAFANTKPDHNI